MTKSRAEPNQETESTLTVSFSPLPKAEDILRPDCRRKKQTPTIILQKQCSDDGLSPT